MNEPLSIIRCQHCNHLLSLHSPEGCTWSYIMGNKVCNCKGTAIIKLRDYSGNNELLGEKLGIVVKKLQDGARGY
jgi:hypothetical protein